MRLLIAVVVVNILAVMSGCSNELQPADDLEARRQHINHQKTKMSAEAQARKDRSIEVLKAEKVPFLESLPVIETEAESTRRTTEEVAMRAMALCIVAAKGEGLEQDMIDKLVKDFELASAFTSKEIRFINNPHPTQHDRIQFAWRYECYWVMLWALGYIDNLERPDKICDVKLAVSLFAENGREGFLKKAKLRPQAEILDAADLIYRYHWAVIDARINNRESPAALDGGIVMERHHALNWLIGYMNQDWDDVSTDT